MNEDSKTREKRSRVRTGFRVLGWTLDTTASVVRGVWGAVKKGVWVVLVLGLLATNIATLASASFLAVASTAFEGVTGLAAGVTALRSRVAVAEQKVTQGARRAATLEADLVRQRATTKRLTQTIERSAVALNKAAGRLEKTGAALLVSNAKMKARTAELAAVNARAFAKFKAVKVITGKISRRAVASASLNLDSLVAQAAPIVGGAVIVGITTWDVTASCATMRDMHELETIFDPDAAALPEETRVCGMRVPTKEELWVKVASAGAWAGSISSGAVEFVKNNMPDLPSLDWSGLTMPQMPTITLPTIDLFKAKVAENQ